MRSYLWPPIPNVISSGVFPCMTSPETIMAKYDLLGVIGKGTYGTAFCAETVAEGARVAVKAHVVVVARAVEVVVVAEPWGLVVVVWILGRAGGGGNDVGVVVAIVRCSRQCGVGAVLLSSRFLFHLVFVAFPGLYVSWCCP